MNNKIFNGDCVNVLKDMEDNYVDLVITSPPYDDLRDYDGYVFDFESIVKELYRVVKDGGVVVWIVGDSVIEGGGESGTSFKQALFFKEVGFQLHDTMIYNKKSTGMPDSTRYLNIFEYMFVFSKGKPKSINLLKDRKNRWAGYSNFGRRTRRDKAGDLVTGKSHVIPAFSKRTNIWEYDTGKGYTTKDNFAFEHPAMFPEQLAKDHILSWSSKGDVVLDPMCGSGTVCKMAKLMSRKYIGIDISERYCKIAKERIKQENLFQW